MAQSAGGMEASKSYTSLLSVVQPFEVFFMHPRMILASVSATAGSIQIEEVPAFLKPNSLKGESAKRPNGIL